MMKLHTNHGLVISQKFTANGAYFSCSKRRARKLSDATTLPRCGRLLASARCHDAATLPGAARVFACSRLRNEIIAPALRPQ
eukprot:s1049_g6.t1